VRVRTVLGEGAHPGVPLKRSSNCLGSRQRGTMEIYKRLLFYLKPYHMRLIWASLFMLLTSAMIATRPTLSTHPGQVIIGRNMQLGLWLPPALIMVSILKGITSYARDYFMGFVGQKVVNDIRDQLYAHFQSLSFSYFTKTPTGIIISRIVNDVNLVQGAITKARPAWSRAS